LECSNESVMSDTSMLGTGHSHVGRSRSVPCSGQIPGLQFNGAPTRRLELALERAEGAAKLEKLVGATSTRIVRNGQRSASTCAKPTSRVPAAGRRRIPRAEDELSAGRRSDAVGVVSEPTKLGDKKPAEHEEGA
jgi:hypothetical protein